MIKKQINLFICIILMLLISFASITVSYAETETIKIGDIIKVPIELIENPGICTARVKIDYDRNVFTLLSQENGDVFPINSFVAGNPESEDCYAVWAGLTDINKTGTLLYIELQVRETAADGEYTISVSYDENDVFNLDEQNVAIEIQNPVIEVGKATQNDSSSNSSSGSSGGSGTSSSSGSHKKNNQNSGVIVKPEAKKGAFDNFKKLREYEENFNDVSKDAWFYDYIKSGYEYKLINGKSDTEFDPSGNITIAEAITLASNLRTIYYGEPLVENSTDGVWYSNYVDYAIKNDIIDSQIFDNYDRPILRKEMAHIFSKSLGAECYENINLLKDIPDMRSDETYYSDVVKLYIAGILTGDDEIGTFGGDRVISRCETAAIVGRLAVPSLRIVR